MTGTTRRQRASKHRQLAQKLALHLEHREHLARPLKLRMIRAFVKRRQNLGALILTNLPTRAESELLVRRANAVRARHYAYWMRSP